MTAFCRIVAPSFVLAVLGVACAGDDSGAGSSDTGGVATEGSAGTIGGVDGATPDGGDDDGSEDAVATDTQDGGSTAGEDTGDDSDGSSETGPEIPRDAVIVAVGYGQRRVRSEDGTTWTDFVEVDPDGGDDENLLRGVGYGNGVFVAVGNRSLRSLDGGITWQDEYDTGGSFLSDAVYMDGMFIAAGGNGTRMRSVDDALSWGDETRFFGGHYRAIAAGNGIAVAVGHTYEGEGLSSTTTDGINWTSELIGGAQYSGDSLAFGNGVFVARDSGGGLHWSADGQRWTDAAQSVGGGGSLLFAQGEFILDDDAGYWTSADGDTWSSSSVEFARSPASWFNGQYLTLGWPATISVSKDLGGWEEVFAPGGSGLSQFAIGTPRR